MRFSILDLFFRTEHLEDRSYASMWQLCGERDTFGTLGNSAFSPRAWTVHGRTYLWCGTYRSRKAGLLCQFPEADSAFVMLCTEQLQVEMSAQLLSRPHSLCPLCPPARPTLEPMGCCPRKEIRDLNSCYNSVFPISLLKYLTFELGRV